MIVKRNFEHSKLSFQYMRIDGKVETLLDFLLRRFRYLNEIEWRNNIAKNLIWVDGRLGFADLKLSSNQKIVYLRPDYLEPKIDPHFEVIYEEDSERSVRSQELGCPSV